MTLKPRVTHPLSYITQVALLASGGSSSRRSAHL